MDATLQLLKKLTEAPGVPGYKAPIRVMVCDTFTPFHRDDCDAAVKLFVAVISRLDRSTVAGLTVG